MAKLTWNDHDFTDDGRFAIQKEITRGEGVCYTLMVHRSEDHRVLVASDIETAFYGRGGKRKVKRAAQELADLADGART